MMHSNQSPHTTVLDLFYYCVYQLSPFLRETGGNHGEF